MNDTIVMALVDLLVKQGYKNVEGNCGTVWYTDENGDTYSISAVKCED